MQAKSWLVGVLLLLCLVTVGCRERNPFYCPPGMDCAMGGGPCESSGECRDPTPVCREDTMLCVECLEAMHCPEERPICSASNTCVACQSDSDCSESGLCLLDGACAAKEEVAYAGGPNKMDNNVCTRDAPCLDLAQALSSLGERKYIKVLGSLVSNGPTTIENKSVGIYGGEGIQLSSSSPGEVLIIKGTQDNLEVSLIDLDVVGNAVTTNKECVSISESPTVTMTRTKVHNHNQAGVSVAGTAKLVLRESQVYNNLSDGVKAIGGTLEVRRSWVYNNKGTGVVATNTSLVTIDSSVIADNTGSSGGVYINGPLKIQNSIIVRNGAASSTTGGLNLSSLDAVFEFNTVVGNVSGALGTPGVTCGNDIKLLNSILVSNAHGIGCTIEYALTALSGMPGGSNKVGDPMFVDTLGSPLGMGFFRIKPGSAARDSASMTATLDVDIDGEPRSDNRKDIGADEYRAAP